ncbi:MAG: UDP-glucose--hexose-1-phosphate uridylyltransferase [Eubacteriales bacterium]|nr:UDP-glucose--hexose-1-phosphate uridylyltransferase [Eubacteriales bacterium]
MTVSEQIAALVQYGIDAGLTPACEKIYTTNLLLELMKEDDYEDPAQIPSLPLEDILKGLLDEACRRGFVEDNVVCRDLFDTKLMNCLVPRPAQVQAEFREKYALSPREATDYFYKLSQDSDYIRRYRVCRDQKWKTPSQYGDMDITINLSKPEKDPKAIAAARNAKASSYPKCQLCMENEGYAGRLNHPARENHRIIPLTINGGQWGFQYSPYVYYNEHCIVFNGEHTPMKIDRAAFTKLFDFVRQFPHYFLGSNADLPIVGGSILSHDHFQGGNYTFAMAKAPIEIPVRIPGYGDVECGIVKWPLSVLRIRCADEGRLIDLASHVLEKWRVYTDEDAFVYAFTDGEPHNTITPIARKTDGIYELDLTLRNNITTEEHPLGVYHPHARLHHIKKENIGLIEVMGLAVLPSRLKNEMALLREFLLSDRDVASDETLAKHADWVAEFLPEYPSLTEENIDGILEQEIGKVFVQVLEDAGVYKWTPQGHEAFLRFIGTL